MFELLRNICLAKEGGILDHIHSCFGSVGLGVWDTGTYLSTSDALFGPANGKGWSCCGHNLSTEMTDL